MTEKLIYSFLIFTIILVGTSCGKQEKEPAPQQKIEGKWKITASTVQDLVNGGTIDIWADAEACERDNTFEFKTGGVFIGDEGSLKCDPADPQQVSGTYSYTSNDKTLTITLNNIMIVSEVLELSSTTLRTRAFSSPRNPIVTYTKIL